jgi:hypothetical protein
VSFEFKVEFSGHKELQRALRELHPRAQRTVIRAALNKRATRIKRRIINNLKARGGTGALARAFAGVKVAAIQARTDTFQGRGIAFPTRSALGLPAKGGYYPTAVEYGYRHARSGEEVGAKPYIRPSVDNHRAEDHAALGSDIGKGLERAWARMAAKRAGKGR